MRSLFIVAFLAVQLALPVSYYLGDAPLDERFAWRMFSPIRMVRCRLDVREGTARTPVPAADLKPGARLATPRTPVRPEAELHAVWMSLLRRGRPDVIAAWADARCGRMERDAGAPVPLYVGVVCRMPDGTEHVESDPEVDQCR